MHMLVGIIYMHMLVGIIYMHTNVTIVYGISGGDALVGVARFLTFAS